MKRISKLLTAVMLAVCLCFSFAFVGCSKALSGEMTVVIAQDGEVKKEYKVDLTNFTSSSRVIDVMNYLHETDDFYYGATMSATGAYVTEIGTYVNETVGEGDYSYVTQKGTPILKEEYTLTSMTYIAVYTSCSLDADVEAKDAIEYGEKKLGYSMFGVSSMHLEKGATVYFTTAIYSYV